MPSRARRTRRSREGREDRQPSGARSGRRGLWGAALCALFVALALLLASPAIEGEFLSDDHLYIVELTEVHGLSWGNVRAILDPWGAPASQSLNYAPLHLLVVASQWQLFGGENTVGWRVVNAVAHGLASALLVLFLLHSGIPATAALLGGAFFLVHPANVEVSAWIFQLKTILSTALALGALMLHPRRPALAVALFGLALLAKITAVFALPVILVRAWTQRRSSGETARWAWLAGWVGLFALVAFPEMDAFQRQADPRLVIHPDPLVHARTIVAIAMRYLVMAASSYGVATFQEPAPAVSWLDPWWLGGLAALALLGWRTGVTLRRSEQEACFWVLAAAAFAPVAQIFPFVYPMADRYLYPILPGLIGGTLLAGRALALRGSPARVEAARQALLIGACAILVLFAVRSYQRAPVFHSNVAMMYDAARNYPEGMQAQILKAHAAVQEGDFGRAVRGFERAVELGFADLGALLRHPQLVVLRGRPDFETLLRDLARRDIERLGSRPDPTLQELIQLSVAHRVRGDLVRAIRALERAVAAAEPPDDQWLREDLERLRRRQRAQGPGARGGR